MKVFVKTGTLILLIGGLVSVFGFYLNGYLFATKHKEIPEKVLQEKGVIYKENELITMTDMAESELAVKIKQALAENPRTSILNLSVNIVGSRVTLSGKAESGEQIQCAVEMN